MVGAFSSANSGPCMIVVMSLLGVWSLSLSLQHRCLGAATPRGGNQCPPLQLVLYKYRREDHRSARRGHGERHHGGHKGSLSERIQVRQRRRQHGRLARRRVQSLHDAVNVNVSDGSAAARMTSSPGRAAVSPTIAAELEPFPTPLPPARAGVVTTSVHRREPHC